MPVPGNNGNRVMHKHSAHSEDRCTKLIITASETARTAIKIGGLSLVWRLLNNNA